MIKNIWAKTILTSYRYLERIADVIDIMVENSGLNSRDISGVNFSYNNILSLSQRMIDLSERKIKLINLKILTEEVLEKCGEIFSEVLILKYLEGKSNTEIIEKTGLANRTYFRRIDEAEKRFENILNQRGYDYEKLEEHLSTENWIMGIKNRIEMLRGGEEFEISDRQLDRLAAS